MSMFVSLAANLSDLTNRLVNPIELSGHAALNVVDAPDVGRIGIQQLPAEVIHLLSVNTKDEAKARFESEAYDMIRRLFHVGEIVQLPFIAYALLFGQ